MKLHRHIKRLAQKGIYFSAISLLCFVVMFGAWCLPPKMIEKILNGMKTKFQTEHILQDSNDPDLD